jgi:tetratricopeptide (TPR) repeat protein
MLMATTAWGLSACQAQRPAAAQAAASAAPSFDKTLADYNAAIASGEATTQGRLQSSLVPLELVGLYAERARLTGSYDDYARAEALIARLEAQFPPSDALCLAKARLLFSVHRLGPAAQALDRCPRLAGEPDALGLRGDIAFQSGRYAEAGAIYRALVNQVGTPQAYVQLALFSAKTGSPGEALAFMEAAEKRSFGAAPVRRSWFALQRGLVELDRGRLDEARALFALADERLPGYWLNEEHLAEVATLNGAAAEAKPVYEAVVRRTGAPEYLDALGSIEAEAGREQAARQLFARAEAAYAQRAQRFPEAIAGHALDHYLSAAPQPAKAQSLAEANYRNRPNGDAAIGLAKAYLLNKKPQAAARLIEQHLGRGWDTAEAYWILSLAADAAGDGPRARTAALEATRRNQRSATQYAFKFARFDPRIRRRPG